MVDETPPQSNEFGKTPTGEGWYVLNLDEAAWRLHSAFGLACRLEGERRHPQMGLNVFVLQPGQPACHYHRENQQEDFLVLAGECLVLIEGEERPLRTWDYLHCPAGTTHVLVGAGEGPSAILAIGARLEKEELFYPLSELAAKHGAGGLKETPSPKESYAGKGTSEPARSPWPVG